MGEFPADGKPIYYVERDPDFTIKASWAPGARSPLTLELATRDHRVLGAALQAGQKGANLVICTDWEGARSIFSAIRDVSRARGLSLPDENEPPA